MARIKAAASFAVTLLAGTATAQPQLPGSGDLIVVEGQKIRATVDEFVERLLPADKAAHLGRWEDPICPSVIGLSSRVSAEIHDRLRAVGRTVRFDVAKPGCAPNLVLIVVPNKKAAIEEFRKKRPEYVKGVSPSLLQEMTGSPFPYASWRLSELIAADGMWIGISETHPGGANGATDERGTFNDLNSALLKTTVSPSRLRNTVKAHVQSAVVLIESGALVNVDTRQLADFTLMQAMLPANRKIDAPPRSSILNVFAELPVSNEAPQSLTYADVAFLRSLGNVRSDSFASIQKNEIRRQMVDELSKASGLRR